MALAHWKVKKKPIEFYSMGFYEKKPGGVLLSHEKDHTIIGAECFHY
jgi:hypothetical protein